MTLEEFIAKAEEFSIDHPYMRTGQAYFNALNIHRSHIAEVIRGTEYDPFHDVEKLPIFLEKVGEELKAREK